MVLLADFHEGHCFFLVGLQIATLVASFADVTLLDTFTIFSLDDARETNKNFSTLGLGLALLNQITLRRLHVSSIYTLLLTTLAAALTFTAQQLAFDRHRITKIIPPDFPSAVPECGNMKSLMLYCDGEASSPYMNYSKPVHYFIMGFILTILWDSKILEEISCGIKSRFDEFTKARAKRARDIATRCLSILVFLCEGYFFGYSVMVIWSHLNYLKEGLYTGLNAENWNIGQVLAVLVWLPVVFKYIYILICECSSSSNLRKKTEAMIRRGNRRGIWHATFEIVCGTPEGHATSKR